MGIYPEFREGDKGRMKKTHLFIIVAAALLACSSIYSLAAMNQIYKIDFDWYSQYNKEFVSEKRITGEDKWQRMGLPVKPVFFISNRMEAVQPIYGSRSADANETRDYSDNYIYINCSLGGVYSPEYRIKVIEIAQRGTVVEVKVSLNSPASKSNAGEIPVYSYYPEDLVRINRASFPVKGGLHFIFKDQDGIDLFDKLYFIAN